MFQDDSQNRTKYSAEKTGHNRNPPPRFLSFQESPRVQFHRCIHQCLNLISRQGLSGKVQFLLVLVSEPGHFFGRVFLALSGIKVLVIGEPPSDGHLCRTVFKPKELRVLLKHFLPALPLCTLSWPKLFVPVHPIEGLPLERTEYLNCSDDITEPIFFEIG